MSNKDRPSSSTNPSDQSASYSASSDSMSATTASVTAPAPSSWPSFNEPPLQPRQSTANVRLPPIHELISGFPPDGQQSRSTPPPPALPPQSQQQQPLQRTASGPSYNWPQQQSVPPQQQQQQQQPPQQVAPEMHNQHHQPPQLAQQSHGVLQPLGVPPPMGGHSIHPPPPPPSGMGQQMGAVPPPPGMMVHQPQYSPRGTYSPVYNGGPDQHQHQHQQQQSILPPPPPLAGPQQPLHFPLQQQQPPLLPPTRYREMKLDHGPPGPTATYKRPASLQALLDASEASSSDLDRRLSMNSSTPSPSDSPVKSMAGSPTIATSPYTAPLKRRGNLPRAVTDILRNWLSAHIHYPYPTESEKLELMKQTGLSLNQVSNWFINARRRRVPAIYKHTPLTTPDARNP